MKYQVMSPDNFAINCNGAIYKSIKQAKKALKKWVKGFKVQGYYSQTCYNGYVREIPLNELADYCDIIKIIK